VEDYKEKKTNPLKALQELGQSIWLDYIRRSLITSGELQRLIHQDGLRGMTSNPAIFEKAITGSTDYADILEELESEPLDAKEIFERIAIRDIQDAAGIMLPVYQATRKRDGYVSLEVSPHLARDTQASIAEARRLWKLVGRPNVMIKIPGTPEGVPAIRQLISEGINVNVTLLFAQEAYVQAAEAYIQGLEEFAQRGQDKDLHPSEPKSGSLGTPDLGHIAGVASFFVSRIDTLVDTLLTAKLQTATDPERQRLLRSLLGQVAIANAKQAYQRYRKLFSGERWQKLAGRGAQTQRVLWASTGTKNPNYSDVLYVESLIGPETVNTIPPATVDAFREHGRVQRTLDADVGAADQTMANLEKAGISMREVTDKLLEDAIKLFSDPFDKLLAVIQSQRQQPERAKSKIS